MVKIYEAFTAYLLNYADLKTLIGNRLYPEEMEQGCDLPAVVYTKISDVKDHALTGQSPLESPMYQFTTYAKTKLSATAVSEQIKNALCDYSGTMNGIEIQHIRLENELSSLEKSSDGLIKMFTEDLEFEINFIKE
jgi:hypothetical protein